MDLFTTDQFKPDIDCTDDMTIDLDSYFDGITVISDEANLGFMCCPEDAIHIENPKAFASFTKLKGLSIEPWDDGLYPLFKFFNYTRDAIHITFVPTMYRDKLDSDLLMSMTSFMRDFFTRIPDVVMKMHGDTSQKNTFFAKKHSVYPNEWSKFVIEIKREYESMVARHDTLLSRCRLHFALYAVGMNASLDANYKPSILKNINRQACIDYVVHLATNFRMMDCVLLWKKEFVDSICHQHGATYYCMGMPTAGNGQGIPCNTRAFRESGSLDGIKYLSLYSNCFKGLTKLAH